MPAHDEHVWRATGGQGTYFELQSPDGLGCFTDEGSSSQAGLYLLASQL